MFGPLLWWELVRLARRGDAARTRVLFLYLLLLTVIGFIFWKAFSVYPSRFFDGSVGSLSPARSDGGMLALILLEVQLVLVAVIAPAYAASTISEEKDRRTLPLLLATALTDGEIVWGKVAGRVLFVLFAVLAGVPVLTMTLFLARRRSSIACVRLRAHGWDGLPLGRDRRERRVPVARQSFRSSGPTHNRRSWSAAC